VESGAPRHSMEQTTLGVEWRRDAQSARQARSALSCFVELLWYYENAPQPHQKERLMPDGCITLIINLLEDETRLYDPDDTKKVKKIRGCSISGPHTICFAIDTDEHGCKELQPVADEFYGDRSGSLLDSWGNHWYIASHLEDLTPEEITEKAAAAARR
jgi:hypothetical protein